MKRLSVVQGSILFSLGVPALLGASHLQPDTLAAWNDYIRDADMSMQSRLDGSRPFLWADEAAGRRARLLRGEILIAPSAGHGSQSVSNGLIHHWIGAAFIPNATIQSVLAVVHDYDRYKEFYRPAVADSKVLPCMGTEQRFSMILQSRVLFVSAAVQGQYEAHDFAVSESRAYNVAGTVEVREIENYGKERQYLLQPGQGNGFLWRLHSIARYEEADGGTYVEVEAIALTRDIPVGLRWVVNPAIKHLSINSLTTSLRETRDAVQSRDAVTRQAVARMPGGGAGALRRSGAQN